MDHAETESVSKQLAAMKILVEELRKDATEMKETMRAALKKAKSERDHQVSEIDSLTEKVNKIEETGSRAPRQTQPDPVLIMKISRGWRFLLFLGGILSGALELFGHIYDDDKWFKISWIFLNFSRVCLFVTVLGNPRNFWNWNEKMFIVFTGFCWGAAEFSAGSWLWATFVSVLASVSQLALVKLYSRLSDRRLGLAITNMFKSLPGILGSTLYVGSSALRCILNSNSAEYVEKHGIQPIEKQCGNPLWPSFYVSCFLMVTWFITYYYNSLPHTKTLSWDDVMLIRMEKVQGVQLVLFTILAIQVLFLYALTDEDGGELKFSHILSTVFFDTEGVTNFMTGLLLSTEIIFELLALFIFCNWIKPVICRQSTRAAANTIVDEQNSFHSHGSTITIESL
ncbi:hypothetical protein TrLO_g10150 [Triparma laevis f. longispina]|uniref:Uncharacterized protein n=1 Tax=Triparma laevis f. longispina TaxID=1714387 RepID=A0A9W7AFI5_9STRA|nr:hypothetical protein TrLO_g10150 [Triparma laevis f. longispina]